MKKIKSSIYYLSIFLLISIFAFLSLKVFHLTFGIVDASEIVLNIFIGAFVPWCMCIFDYIHEVDRQDSIFLNGLQYYYSWLNSFEKSLNSIKESKKYLKIYNEYYLRLQVLNNLIKEKNDVCFYEKHPDLLHAIDITDGLIFYALDYDSKKNKENVKNAKILLEETLQSVREEKNNIDNIIYNLPKCKLKKEWYFYRKIFNK